MHFLPFLLAACLILLLPFALLLIAFLVALADYLRGGGTAATITGANSDHRLEPEISL